MTMFQRLYDQLSTLILKFRHKIGFDKVEHVDAESVDPGAPLPQGAEEMPQAPQLTFFEKLKALPSTLKTNIYNFFVPPPTMVPAQLETPEIDFDDGDESGPLKGQMIYVLIAVFFVVAVVWAALAQIDEVVRAEGAVVPSDNVQVVQSRLPGSIVDIKANLGDRVLKGDVLFRIEDEDVVANFDDNEINRYSALAAIVRLEAERDGAITITFPQDLIDNAPEIVAQERALFYSRQTAKDGELDVLTQESESLQRAIKEREAEARVASRQVDTIEKEREILAPLVEKGFEPELVLLSIDARLQEAMGRKELAELGATRLRSDLTTQQKKFTSLVNRFKTDAETQLVEMRTLAAQAAARLDALRGKVAYAEVRVPVDGTISVVHIKTVGGVVEAGAVLAEVIPFEEEVTVRARVMPDDVAKIVPGQRVRISLSSYDVSRYARLMG